MMPVARLLRSSFAGSANPVSSMLIVAENALGLRERMTHNVMLVAVRSSTDPDIRTEPVAGFVELLTPEWLRSDAAVAYPDRVRGLQQPYIFSLAVDNAARSKGVASALMDAAEERARSMGHSRLHLEVEDTNLPALKL